MPKAVELRDRYKKENIAYRKSIRAKCIDCMCEQKLDCEIPDCPLYPFRPYQSSGDKSRA